MKAMPDITVTLMKAFLSLTPPDCPIVNIDFEHRYDWVFPHVFQIPGKVERKHLGGYVDIICGGDRGFVSDGETVITAAVNLSFGVETITWDDPCRMTLWGKPLLDKVLPELEKKFPKNITKNSVPVGRVREESGFLFEIREKIKEAFQLMNKNGSNWSISERNGEEESD